MKNCTFKHLFLALALVASVSSAWADAPQDTYYKFTDSYKIGSTTNFKPYVGNEADVMEAKEISGNANYSMKDGFFGYIAGPTIRIQAESNAQELPIYATAENPAHIYIIGCPYQSVSMLCVSGGGAAPAPSIHTSIPTDDQW